MLTITLTPTTLVFKELPPDVEKVLRKTLKLEWSEKGYLFVKGDPKTLYKILLDITYTYDVELT